MDIVDTFNHLIPSDQLDSLLIGQNLECEAINVFGTSLNQLGDSLKNMLSDKDPMFGSASSQFNLRDNDDTNFQIAGSTVPDFDSSPTESGLNNTGGELTREVSARVKRSVGRPKKYAGRVTQEGGAGKESSIKSINTKPPGRPGKRGVNRQQKPVLIQKGASASQVKRELALGGRINIYDLELGPWLNPVVVLRRLTVTVGGFRIELLPGPSHTNADQSICLEHGFSYGGVMEYAMVQNEAVDVQNLTPQTFGSLDIAQTLVKCCGDGDLPLGLGPYVNPNDVQAANGAILGSLAETKLNNQSDSQKHGPVGVANKDGKEQRIPANKQLKQALSSAKNKHLVPRRLSSMVKGPQHVLSKKIQRGDLESIKAMTRKQVIMSLKRPSEYGSTQPAPKIQRLQDGSPVKLKLKLPDMALSPKKTLLPDNRPDVQQGMSKHPHSHVGPKSQSAHLSPGKPGHPLKETPEVEAGEQEPHKVKKPEKTLQKQKSRNASRTISVEEPQLFIPDNAPVVKKETIDEEPVCETVWELSKSCGLCKTDHSNRFMVGCGRCGYWFHGDCVGLDLLKVQQMEKDDQVYVCLKCCSEDNTKVEPDTQEGTKMEDQPKLEAQVNKLPLKQKQGSSQPVTSGGVRPSRKDSAERRQSTEVKDAVQKTGVHVKQETKSKMSPASSKKPSVEHIRRSVRDTLKDILLKRLKESDLKVSTEKVAEVSKKTERELFHFYRDTDSKYKSKYRSLTFNLKDTKNNVLFKRVLKGGISPGHLIRMSPEELASQELAAWRQRENRHTIEMIEKEQREAERRPITKITHKGEIEIESQEPVKTPEAIEVEPEPAPKVPEVPVEAPQEKKTETIKIVKDTTSQHKSHLFDLHCKICTGRMAPPVEEAPTKVVKVATTVVRRQSSMEGETKGTPSTAKDDDLHLSVLEESLLSSEYERRSDYTSGRVDEAAFLANLQSLWRGFVNMPTVAKLVTRAYPVSGVLDHLTEDLQDSIQVGGRISPQIVWDYFERIRATGTKEVCLIRFSPETEEDEISYTLLYAYFSSRKRFGVVANNLKQVKDMYLIPLGAIEKVPHQLVPFDGPGFEANRPNLLLGLIIRQRPKRDFLPVNLNETARFIASKPQTVPIDNAEVARDEDNSYLTSLIATHTKEAEEQPKTAEDVAESNIDSPEKASSSDKGNLEESNKPLRFLPGVLLGWGGELPPLPDVSCKPTPANDDPQKTKEASKVDGAAQGNTTKSASRLDRFVIKKREQKIAKAELTSASVTEKSLSNNSLTKDVNAVNHSMSVSLKDEPPDVSTEAFLAGLSTAPVGSEPNSTVSNKGDSVSDDDKANQEKPTFSSPTASSNVSAEESPSTLSPSQAVSGQPKSLPKPPPSGILKKSSAYSNMTEEKRTEVAHSGTTSHPVPQDQQPVSVLSTRKYQPVATQHGYLHQPQTDYRPMEEVQNSSNPGPLVLPAVYPHPDHGPQAASYTTPQFQYQPQVAPAIPTFNNTTPFPPQLHPPQVPANFGYPSVPPPMMFPPPDHLNRNHAPPWPQPRPTPLNAVPGPPLAYNIFAGSSNTPPFIIKEDKGPDRLYSDPWAKQPRHPEDGHKEHRDEYERHRHHSESHYGKKSRCHDRDRDNERGRKREHGYEDKHKERSRHHEHLKEDRHGERRKERHHSDDHSSRHKDRHRKDSGYDKGRRTSKDSHS